MKYQLSINQRAIIESGLDIDLIDAVIIDCMAGMFARTSLKKMIDNGKCYTWIAMSTVERELPIIRLKKRAIVSRITALADIGIIERHQDNQSNSMSFFCAGVNWDSLFVKQQDAQSLRLATTECSNMHSPMQQDAQPPMQQDAYYPNTNTNQNTNNQKEEDSNFSNLPSFENKNIETLEEQPGQQLTTQPSEEKEKNVAPKKENEGDVCSLIWTRFIAAYDDFHIQQTTLPIPFEEGKSMAALKRLLEYLVKASEKKIPNASQAEYGEQVLKMLSYIFSNWNKLTPFYQNHVEPSKFLSSLPGIMQELKNPKSTTKHKGIAPVSTKSPEESAAEFKAAGWKVKMA